MNNETKERVTCNGKLGVRASGVQVAPIALAIGFPDSDEPAARFMEWYNPAHWIWWGRGLGTFIGILVREREEAVRRAERERIAGIVEGMRICSRSPDICDALTALLDRLREGA